MNKSYIISGSLFGDEGKGTFVDYIANRKNIRQNVRYNGGSQASHTVMVGDTTHKFSQLGSSMYNEGNKTYLSSNTIVNPFNLYEEAKRFNEEEIQQVLKRIFIDTNALVVTPYHSLIDKIISLSTNNSRGCVGTGVSITKKLYENEGLGIRISDLVRMDSLSERKIKELFRYTILILESKCHLIDKKTFDKLIDKKDVYNLTNFSNEDFILNCYRNIMSRDLFNTVSSIKEFYTKGEDLLMEGSQGFFIDKDYGIKPNTCFVDTTNKYGVELSNDIGYISVRIGASRAFASRHGNGILLTESSELNSLINDSNQTVTYYQGKPKYGWYDLILMKYSDKVSEYDELFLSSLDILSSLDEINICAMYEYHGDKNDKLYELFEIEESSNHIYITGIKKNDIDLINYLKLCSPVFIKLKGWRCDISGITSYEDLPIECIDYIEYIENALNIPITLIGVGPKRENKIVRLLN